MHYGEIIFNDTVNGKGIRLSLFVSGCNHHCKGCFQPETWDPNYGKEFTEETLNLILDELQNEWYDGITFLGGDPLYSKNQKTVLYIIKKIRKELPNKTIWLYTGDLLENLIIKSKSNSVLEEILKNIDILVDGPFIEDEKDIRLSFRGSSNQRVIDMHTIQF